MEITKTQSGEILEVRIKGRLDGYWADDLTSLLFEAVREGAHHIRVDLAGIDYMSSIGLGALIQIHQHLAGIQGSFAVVNPSRMVHKLLQLSGVDHLLMPATDPVSAPVSAERKSETVDQPNFTADVFGCVSGSKLKSRVIGRPDLLQRSQFRKEHCRTISLPESVTAIGLGALGEGFEDCKTRFGEFLAVSGVAAYQPTDGSSVADHLSSTGTFVPSIQALYGITFEGQCSHTMHFQHKKGTATLKLSDLIQAAMKIARTETVGMVKIGRAHV